MWLWSGTIIGSWGSASRIERAFHAMPREQRYEIRARQIQQAGHMPSRDMSPIHGNTHHFSERLSRTGRWSGPHSAMRVVRQGGIGQCMRCSLLQRAERDQSPRQGRGGHAQFVPDGVHVCGHHFFDRILPIPESLHCAGRHEYRRSRIVSEWLHPFGADPSRLFGAFGQHRVTSEDDEIRLDLPDALRDARTVRRSGTRASTSGSGRCRGRRPPRCRVAGSW